MALHFNMSITMSSEQIQTVIASSVRRLSEKYNFSYDDAMLEIQQMDLDISRDDKRKTPSRPKKPRMTAEEREAEKLAKKKAKEEEKLAKAEAKKKAKEEEKLAKAEAKKKAKEEEKLAKKKAKEEEKLAKAEAKKKAKEEEKLAKAKAKEEEKLAKAEAKKKAKEEEKLAKAKAKEEEKLAKAEAKKKAKGYDYPLPFLGVVCEDQCQGIKLNYGLHTQCTGKKTDNDFCRTCNKAIDKSETKKHPYGIIRDRLNADGSILLPFYDNKGCKTVCYKQYLMKMKYDVEEVKAYFEQQGVDIPEFYWEEEVEEEAIKKRGRPKKQKSLTDSSDDDLATAISNIVREDDTDDDDNDNEKDKESMKLSSDNSASSITSGITNDDNDDNDDNTETEDESVSVVRIVIDGKNYLLSDDNEVYDAESENLVGHYNKKTKQIIPHNIKHVVDDGDEDNDNDDNDDNDDN